MKHDPSKRVIGFVLISKKAEEAFTGYCPEKIVRFIGYPKKEFEAFELKGLKRGEDYETMWS